jgi:RNA polymerase sigma factor (sigma-70 family)
MTTRSKTTSSASASKHDRMIAAAYAQALRWAKRRIDYDTAEDIAAEVMTAIWRRLESNPGSLQKPGEAERFVATTARHALLDRKRDDGRRSQREAEFERESRAREPVWMSPEDDVSYAQLRKAFEDVLARTAIGRRLAYMLVHEEELTLESAAVKLDLSPQVVQKRVYRTRLELREELAAYRTGDCAEPAPKAQAQRKTA